MKWALLITAILIVIAACGCVEGFDDGVKAPTLAPMPTAEPLPTVAPLPTAEPLPTLPPTPTSTPVPPSSGDPIIGTWRFVDNNGNLTVYDFRSDGTFDRHDTDKGTAYSGTWDHIGGDTYELIYDMPGHTKETVTYSPRGTRMERNDTYYTRV